MAYPLSESWRHGAATGYAPQSSADVRDGQQRAATSIDMQARLRQQPVHLRFKETAHGDFAG